MSKCSVCRYREPCEQLNYLDVANTCSDLRKYVDEIRADAKMETLKPIQKLLDDWFCDREDDANRVLSKISICIFEMTKEHK